MAWLNLLCFCQGPGNLPRNFEAVSTMKLSDQQPLVGVSLVMLFDAAIVVMHHGREVCRFYKYLYWRDYVCKHVCVVYVMYKNAFFRKVGPDEHSHAFALPFLPHACTDFNFTPALEYCRRTRRRALHHRNVTRPKFWTKSIAEAMKAPVPSRNPGDRTSLCAKRELFRTVPLF